ncbi:MAG: RNA 2',3'-cyclic phosphodiesterase [Ignavibacteriales bacterium]|nr:RNA 2',3'-cyclic phosphodiesterase [Ignavibacteriales bacterium]
MKIRSFIALEIPDDPLLEILKIRNEKLGKIENIRWEEKEKLHLTLKFLGDIDSEMVGQYSKCMQKIIDAYESLNLSFSEFGVFKRRDEYKILWAGLTENKRLLELVDEIDTSFADFGIEKERKNFKSHITLLRFRGYEDSEKIVSLTHVKLPVIEFKANKITLFESKLLPSGSVYRSLKKFYLKN